ncbi:hypothetical protein PVAP13_8NG052201 [Panicum virgatum]|uniref:Uncharacterized protein n=1 Tax=Panicum virgatum TaxID=38727 RepID=A0A8T0P6S3_PANVG|nr:hypothetical protein PVAP13_8NG052201 [Panicum virgatum]
MIMMTCLLTTSTWLMEVMPFLGLIRTTKCQYLVLFLLHIYFV